MNALDRLNRRIHDVAARPDTCPGCLAALLLDALTDVLERAPKGTVDDLKREMTRVTTPASPTH